jgi:hypothetical protein
VNGAATVPRPTEGPDEPTTGGSHSGDLRASPEGAPAPPGSSKGRAAAFRQKEAQRRGERWELILDITVGMIIVLGIYTVVTAAPYPASRYEFQVPGMGPTIDVHFGTPSVSAVTCGAGGVGYAETIPWVGASAVVTTADFIIHVSEVWDGDYIQDPHVVANATPTNVCAGPAPSTTKAWYVVLAAPNGTNLLTYTVVQQWSSISHGNNSIPVENGSALILLTYASLAGTGRGLSVAGYFNGSLIRGVTPL